MNTPNDARRRVLKLAVACLSALASSAIGQQAEAAELEPLSESDPAAKALGYVTDVARVDSTTNPMFKPGSRCSNCLQFQGKADAASGRCTIFPGKTVAANGWCGCMRIEDCSLSPSDVTDEPRAREPGKAGRAC